MKKLISVFIFSILACNFSASAMKQCDSGNCQKDWQAEPVPGKFKQVVKSLLSTGVALGTFAGLKGLSKLMNLSDSKVTRIAGKTLIGVVGICASLGSMINSGNNLIEISEAAIIDFDIGKVNQFCVGLNAVNIFSSLYTLKYIVSGQIFSNK